MTTGAPFTQGSSNQISNAIQAQSQSSGFTQALFDALLAASPPYAQTAAELAASVTPADYAYAPGNFLRYGADPTGATASDAAIASAILSGASPYGPIGTYLVQANHPITKAGTRIHGDGAGATFIHVQATSGVPVLDGFSVRANDVTFDHLTILSDVNGQTLCVGVTWDTNSSSNTRFESGKSLGITTKTNNWGMRINGANTTGQYWTDWAFELLDEPIAKSNSDTSSTVGTFWENVNIFNCTNAGDFNSPAGIWTGISIRARADTCSQFGFAFANCQQILLDVICTNIQAEAIHFEAGSANARCRGVLTNCNQATPFGTTGFVNIISSSHDIDLELTIDMTQNSAGTPNGVCINQGGAGVTPYDIDIRSRFLCNASCSSAILVSPASGPPVGIDFSGSTFVNPSASSKIQYFLNIGACKVNGIGLKFINPGVIAHINDNTFGKLQGSDVDGDLTTSIAFAWLSGNTNGTTSIEFEDFTIHRSFTATASSTPQPIFPAGSGFNGTCTLKFVQNGTTATFWTIQPLVWTGSALTAAASPVQSGAGGTPPPTSAQWTQSGGVILAACTGNATYAGNVLANFKGSYFP